MEWVIDVAGRPRVVRLLHHEDEPDAYSVWIDGRIEVERESYGIAYALIWALRHPGGGTTELDEVADAIRSALEVGAPRHGGEAR